MAHSKTHKLDTIINVREHQKKTTTRELMTISTEKNLQIEKLDGLNDQQRYAFAQAFSTHRTKAGTSHSEVAFMKRISVDIKNQEKHVAKIEVQEEKKREELIERVKAEKIVEKLQERFIQEAHLELERKEQNFTDSLNQRLVLQR
jgi:flagellar export protein FliJ